MILDFNFNFKDLSGKEITGEQANAGKLLANLLALSNKGNAIKLMFWANKLFAGETIEIDPSDVKILTTFIQETDKLSNLTKAQLLEKLS